MLPQNPLANIDPDHASEKGNPHARREEYARTVLDELLNPLHIHTRLLPANHLLLEEEEERDCRNLKACPVIAEKENHLRWEGALNAAKGLLYGESISLNSPFFL